MSSTGKTPFSEHPEENLLLYLEDQLTPELRDHVEQHVRECPQCAWELEKLAHAIASLKAHKEAFCPEAWELYDFVDTAADSSDTIARHVEQCPLCSEEMALYTYSGEKRKTPESIARAVEENFPGESHAPKTRTTRGAWSSLIDTILTGLSHPVAALGYAAAAILLVILAYPRGEPAAIMGLSPVTWAELDAGHLPQRVRPKLKLMGPAPKRAEPERVKPRVATVLFFKGFSGKVSQESIDDLYRALKPPLAIERRYRMIPPAETRKRLAAGPEKPVSQGNELIEEIGSRLEASEALLLTVAAEGNSFTIEGELVLTSDGTIQGKAAAQNVKKADLPSKLREVSLGLLTANDGPSPRSP